MKKRARTEAPGVEVSRKQFVLGSLAAMAAAALGRVVLGRYLPAARADGERWYEIVQDMKQDGIWHVNLFAGPALGDLGSGVLVEHVALETPDVSRIKAGLDDPWRVQYRDGLQEQSF